MARGCSWAPKAYGDVDLDVHNAAVAAGVYALFRERLLRPGPPGRLLDSAAGVRGALLAASVLAGAFHDAGKASPSYRGASSYYGHELASAAVLDMVKDALLEEGDRGTALIVYLAAWAAARHHSAQELRHPAHATEKPGLARRASAALEGLAREPGCLEAGLPEPLRGGRVARLALEALEGIGTGRAARRLSAALKALASYNPRFWGIPEGAWLAVSSTAAGALIVADILVASSEGRDTDDGAGKVYVEWWRRELPREGVAAVEGMAGRRGPALEALRAALQGIGARL